MAKKAKGATAAHGPRGHRGERGVPGERGERGEPGIAPRALADLVEAVRQLRADSEIQLQRIADLQAQLDVTLGEFRRLQPSAERPERRSQKRN